MKTLWTTALVGLCLTGGMDPVAAQRGGRDYGYDEREYGGRSRGYDEDDERPRRGRGYDDDSRDRERGRRYDEDRGRERNRGYDDEDRGRERGRGYREESEAEFDEEEYLRCHPDVRRAVKRGEMASGASHFKLFGRREGRSLTCPTRL